MSQIIVVGISLISLVAVNVGATTLIVTNSNDTGAGSLRSTLASSSSGDTIQFSMPLPATISLTSGELFVTNNVTISGLGAPNLSISGNTNSRVFHIATNCAVSLSDLCVRDGRADTNGGGILNAGTLTLSNCLIAFNSAGDYVAGSGGGIHNSGTLTVVGCTFRSNQAGTGYTGAGGGGGIGGSTPTPGGPGGVGGGIANVGSLITTSSTFYDNRAGTGGNGGAQYGSGYAGNGGFGGIGGAIYTDGSLTCVSCTFNGNHAGKGGTGGYAISFPSPGYGGAGGTGGGGGGIVVGAGTATIRNTIVALNVVGEGGAGGFGGASGPDGPPGSLPDMIGTVTSQGHNLIGANSGSTGLTNGINGNIVGTTNSPVNPRLGALQDNGGPTWTMSLLTGSPALDAGDDALTGTDQRGFPRPSGAHVDIGAFEGVSEMFSLGEALLVAEGHNNSVAALEVRTGAAVGTLVQPGAGTSYQILGPRAMLCVSNYLLLINQNVDTPYNGEILKFDLATGVFLSKFVPGSNPNAPYAPRGMIVGQNNVLYVADFGGFDGVHPGRIARYNSAGTFLGNVVTTGLVIPFYPFALVVGPDGLLYVSGVGNLAQGSMDGFIFRFQFNAGTQNYQYLDTIVASTAANYYSPGLHSPEGIVFGPDGNIYITSFYAYFNDNIGNPVIHRDGILVFNKSGQPIGSPLYLYGEAESRVFAQSLLFGPRGDLFVPITSGSSVRRYSASSNYQQFTVLPTSGEPPIEPWYLTFRATHPSTLAYQPPALTGILSGDNFDVSWPAGYVGWQLQAQTNSLTVGLNSNWISVPESLLTHSLSFTRTNPFAAFRLLAP